MNTSQKRYVITYKNGNISARDVSKILSIKDTTIHDAVTYLSSGKIIHENDIFHFHGLGSSSISLTDKEVEKLNNDAQIIAIEEDKQIVAADLINQFETQTKPTISLLSPLKHESVRYADFSFSLTDKSITWNIDLVKAPQAWSKGITGKNIKVAVLDTGIASHSDVIISGGVSFVSGSVAYQDGNGHGTHCAGIIAAGNNINGIKGVAPDANLFAVKVLNDVGKGSLTSVLAGMAWAKDNNMDIVNMSLGGVATYSVAYQNAVYLMLVAGVTVVCASGNCMGDAINSANSYGAIAVGAINNKKMIADFSSMENLYNKASIVAPGVNVYSTYLNNSYAILSGSSMATPHAAGAAALVKQKFPGISPAEILFKLRNTSTQSDDDNAIFGNGIINCDAATN